MGLNDVNENREVAPRMRVLELEEKIASLEAEMRSRDEDAEKMLVLLHEQLTLEQQTRKDLQDQLLFAREKLRVVPTSRDHRQCPGDQTEGGSKDAGHGSRDAASLSGSFVRLSHLDEAQGVETEELLSEIARLQVSASLCRAHVGGRLAVRQAAAWRWR